MHTPAVRSKTSTKLIPAKAVCDTPVADRAYYCWVVCPHQGCKSATPRTTTVSVACTRDPSTTGIYPKNKKIHFSCEIDQKGVFDQNSALQGACDTSIARVTGCVYPRGGYSSVISPANGRVNRTKTLWYILVS